MFSVDNFYDFFVAEYGHNKTNNFVVTFQPHGSKDLHNLEPFGINPQDDQEKLSKFNRIIMHDQEPVFLDYMSTYRKSLANQKNCFIVENQRQQARLDRLSKLDIDLDIAEFLRRSVTNHGSIVVCHSEKNSRDIEILREKGFGTCYYWWHGMIARDWFRHWEHYQDLQVTDKSSGQRFLLYCRAVDGSREYRKTLLAHCEQHKDQIRYNWNRPQVDPTYSAKIEITDAVNSAVHLVAETLFDTDKIYLTEKVFKPMVMSQPFILFAPPNSLEYLKNYGFKTFHECWDESYDQETDAEKRLDQLLSLIDHIANMSSDEFQEIYQRAMPIIEHNRKRFFSTAFQDDLILEMRTNMSQVLFEQNQRHEHGLDNESSADGNDVQ